MVQTVQMIIWALSEIKELPSRMTIDKPRAVSAACETLGQAVASWEVLSWIGFRDLQLVAAVSPEVVVLVPVAWREEGVGGNYKRKSLKMIHSWPTSLSPPCPLTKARESKQGDIHL